MSEKFQPGEEMFDEVEGHGRKGPGIVADEDSDVVEGHKIKFIKAAPDDEDTEGHAKVNKLG